MKQLTYSSTAAFLAHYRILRDAGRDGRKDALPAQDGETLRAMQQLMHELKPEERNHLLSVDGGAKDFAGEERRRQERAQLKLRHLLTARGVLRS